jgi:(2Fe-2S) ferredoxin
MSPERDPPIGVFGDSVKPYSTTSRNREIVGDASFRRHVFVCTEKDGCGDAGGRHLKTLLSAGVFHRNLDDIKVSPVESMGFCELGPVVVVYPDDVWYAGVDPADIEAIIEQHLVNEDPIADLRFDPEEYTHVIVCTFLANCAMAGGGSIHRRFAQLAAGVESTKVTRSNGCLKECSMAPVCCVYPDGDWYTGISEQQVEGIWRSYLADEPSVYATGRTGNST